MIEKHKNPVKIRNVMTSNVTTVTPRTSLVTVSNLMAEKKISCVVVTDKDRILGIISERDLVKWISSNRGHLKGIVARQAMSSPVETITATASLDNAITIMSEKGYRRLPVLDTKDRLIGIVTRSDVLRSFTRELEIAHEHMKDLAIRDSLTGLYNRRFFMEFLEREFYKVRRYGGSLSLILLDIDDFKSINDEHGHQFGDKVLQSISEILKKRARTSDVVSRYGGEEFTVIASNTGMEHACLLAERLCEGAEKTGLTLSAGVTCYPGIEAKFPEDLIRQADTTMYQAKIQGKNRVLAWHQDFEEL